MTLRALNLRRYKEWTIEQLYYLLFPYIKEDFMGKQDCESIHAEGNMTVSAEQIGFSLSTGSPTIVTHILRGGSDLMLASKEAEYRINVEEGRRTIERAQESGDFDE